ncbi:MAG: 50S ribosomal protein L13 [Candidatus Kerfeldbacteria bacterium]|nr:50S ribosomal protein L13 [Candidatus Kerfeldbacteria bacterium]
MTKFIPSTVTIDASGRSLGRVCAEAASKLRGKHLVTFAPHLEPQVSVNIINIDKLRFTGTKLEVKHYYSFSGYPGGIKSTTLRQQVAKNPVRLVRRAVERMLPKNRLKARLLKRLNIYRGEAKSK